MLESDEKSQSVKERDYKIYRKEFQEIIKKYGLIFHQKHFKENLDDLNVDVYNKFINFIPELNEEHINFMINIYGNIGIKATNHNFLAIFRYFHYAKYK